MSRINTNVTSMIAARVLNTQRIDMNDSLERLSTGLRINRGADDPSGLIASEVLRGEMTSLGAAIANGERAANVISTAEGALNEVSSLLTQLEELVSGAANEGGQGSDEIEAKQLQVDSILSTINRISNSTEFEGKKLLDGTLDYQLSNTGSNLSAISVRSAKLIEGQTRTVTIEVTNSAEFGRVWYANSALGSSNTTIQVTGTRGSEIMSFAGSTAVSAIAAAINQVVELTGVSATTSSNNSRIWYDSIGYGSNAFVTVEVISGAMTIAGGTSGRDTGVDASVLVNGQSATTDGLTASINTDSLSMEVDMSTAFGQALGTHTFGITGGGATFSLSPDVLTGRASLGISSVASGSLGDVTNGYLSSLASGQTNNVSSNNLGTAQRIVKSAIKEVASLRGRLGAFQKLTVESTVNSLNVALENTAAAESAIRDTDFASETANLTRSQILVQAATTVLRQANSSPQNALALLG